MTGTSETTAPALRTQAWLEAELLRRLGEIVSGRSTAAAQFGDGEDWTLELGGHRALLHPVVGQWLWYDRVHDEWRASGFGLGQAILLVLDGLLGAKALPGAPAPRWVGEWCVFRVGAGVHGPVLLADLLRVPPPQAPPDQIAVWSPAIREWRPLTQVTPVPPPPWWDPGVLSAARAVAAADQGGAAALTQPQAAPDAAVRFCWSCGQGLQPDAGFCTACGARRGGP